MKPQLIFHIIWRSPFIFSHENHWAAWSLWIEIFPNEIQLFSNTLSFNLNGRSHIIFAQGFCVWKAFEFMEIRKQIWKFGKVLLFPLIELSKSFEFTHFQTINQTISQIYLFIITFQNLEFWDVTNLPPLKWILSSRFGEASKKRLGFGGLLKSINHHRGLGCYHA